MRSLHTIPLIAPSSLPLLMFSRTVLTSGSKCPMDMDEEGS